MKPEIKYLKAEILFLKNKINYIPISRVSNITHLMNGMYEICLFSGGSIKLKF